MSEQSDAVGNIVQGDDPTHPTFDQREEILEAGLNTWGWKSTIQRHDPQGRFVKFSAHSQKADADFELEMYIFPNLADSARNRPHEKRIRLTRAYDEHQVDFELDKVGVHRCLLLGIYRLTADDIVICAWDAAAYQGHRNPNSCYVDIKAIAGAFRSGFDRSQDNKGRYVCCFRPEFLPYYIENMGHLHVVGSVEEHVEAPEPEAEAVECAENVIYYGAPGTGKSHRVDERVAGQICVRTVFHPDMQNSDFVGALKPVMQEDRISYSFSPGPFAIALRNAMAHPGRETFLVIEELNRAPAAAVFGDLFLLLDRDSKGRGKYDVDFPTPEFRAWLCTELGQGIERISLPSNLWLLATMNSADQGVYPIDTAFRRRWRQLYVPIDYSAAPKGSVNFILTDGTSRDIEWAEFARTLNTHLIASLSIAEDRLLGPWFVTPEDLNAAQGVPGKVLIYLWDDLLRNHGRDRVFDMDAVGTFGQVSTRVQDNRHIFSAELLAKLSGAAQPAGE